MAELDTVGYFYQGRELGMVAPWGCWGLSSFAEIVKLYGMENSYKDDMLPLHLHHPVG